MKRRGVREQSLVEEHEFEEVVMRKKLSALMMSSLLMGTALMGTLGCSAGEVKAAEKQAVIYVDESTSMSEFANEAKRSALKLANSLKDKGFKVVIKGFGKDVKPLNLNAYKASENDTNYDAVLSEIGKSKGVVVFIVTDGRVPAKRLKEFPSLVRRARELEDQGDVVCVDSALKEPTKLMKDLGAVVKPFGEEKELVEQCLNVWSTLGSNSAAKSSKVARVKSVNPFVPKDIEESGFPGSARGQGNVKEIENGGSKVVIQVFQK